MPLSLTPEQRTLRARRAALARWAKYDPTDQARAGQRGLLEKFVREVDPDLVLPEAERYRRADAARRGHMAALALKSSRARSRRAGTATD